MTRKYAQDFIRSLINLRATATDEQALDASAVYPQWKADVEYKLNDRVLYNEVLYKVITAHTSQETWTPVDSPSLFAKVLTDEDVILPWEQPDSTNGYKIGDKVLYNGEVYVSIIDNNVWAPDAYGWEKVQ